MSAVKLQKIILSGGSYLSSYQLKWPLCASLYASSGLMCIVIPNLMVNLSAEGVVCLEHLDLRCNWVGEGGGIWYQKHSS